MKKFEKTGSLKPSTSISRRFQKLGIFPQKDIVLAFRRKSLVMKLIFHCTMDQFVNKIVSHEDYSICVVFGLVHFIFKYTTDIVGNDDTIKNN